MLEIGCLIFPAPRFWAPTSGHLTSFYRRCLKFRCSFLTFFKNSKMSRKYSRMRAPLFIRSHLIGCSSSNILGCRDTQVTFWSTRNSKFERKLKVRCTDRAARHADCTIVLNNGESIVVSSYYETFHLIILWCKIKHLVFKLSTSKCLIWQIKHPVLPRCLIFRAPRDFLHPIKRP